MENREALLSALEWYVDAGVTIPVENDPNNRFSRTLDIPDSLTSTKIAPSEPPQKTQATASADIIKQAQAAADDCSTLDELRAAILAFDAHPLKKLATNMVFGDGNPQADIMVIGDPPATDEDRSGQAFCGVDGQLLDKILVSIGLSRDTVYLTHIINWRPPGNRTPLTEEIAISLPFIQKHIELVSPKHVVLMGGIAGKSILKATETMSRMRGKFHDYGDTKTPALTTYTPSFLIANPLQKRKVWQDMLALRDKIDAIS